MLTWCIIFQNNGKDYNECAQLVLWLQKHTNLHQNQCCITYNDNVMNVFFFSFLFFLAAILKKAAISKGYHMNLRHISNERSRANLCNIWCFITKWTISSARNYWTKNHTFFCKAFVHFGLKLGLWKTFLSFQHKEI